MKPYHVYQCKQIIRSSQAFQFLPLQLSPLILFLMSIVVFFKQCAGYFMGKHKKTEGILIQVLFIRDCR